MMPCFEGRDSGISDWKSFNGGGPEGAFLP
jgi:hypothetical protein